MTSATMWINVRLPGSNTPEVIEVESDTTAAECVHDIAEKLALPSLGADDISFVVSPTACANGAIVSSKSTFRQLMFNPRDDVLELWRSPRLMNCALVFKEGSTVVVRDKKMLPMDFGSPLLQMVANNQRAFSLPEDLEFTYQYSESAQDAHTAQMRPLHTQSSLSEQDVSCDGVLLCFPVSKLLSSPEGSFENPQIRGWLWKRSYKRDRVSTKQKRFFVLNGSFLYYYKKERDALASGVIPLEYYVANVKKVEKKFSFLLTKSFDGFRGMTTQYKLQAETRDLLDIWLELIKKQCVNSGNKKSVWSGS
eukprot:TRINITY_DN2092_c0_g1_i2.p1 TRINITY_DN2092_c0_g1~~TRINITY_DN2092_c0_g1_i2.p1  ORF type:complete len:309 (+),score=99.25 TRINITY_DN2092_c0_g1_i2:112-1038(+)